MDHRDVASHLHLPYTVDESKGVIVLTHYGEDDEGDYSEEIELPLEWEVCPTCRGNGKHVNPSIDAQGLTAEDFEDDPDFAESYFAGRYDVRCSECDGRRVVATSSDQRFQDAVSEAWRCAAEDCRGMALGY